MNTATEIWLSLFPRTEKAWAHKLTRHLKGEDLSLLSDLVAEEQAAIKAHRIATEKVAAEKARVLSGAHE